MTQRLEDFEFEEDHAGTGRTLRECAARHFLTLYTKRNNAAVQGCSFGLERLGLETFFGTSRLVSVFKVERLSLVSVLKI